jgi:hypothetical protein
MAVKTVSAAPGNVVIAPVSAPVQTSAAADIAAFIAEGHKADDGDVPGGVSEAEDGGDGAVADEGGGDETAPAVDEPAEATEDEPGEEGSEEAPADVAEVDPAALASAVKAKDLAALLKAMGPAAEEMLTSKAHVTLRRQIRDLEKQEAAATAKTAKADELAVQLGQKYGDPIEARKRAEQGDVDGFLDLIEKWGGHDWNTMIRWVTNGISGRKERLEAKAAEKTTEVSEKETKRQAALTEAKTWVTGVISKADSQLVKDCPGVVDLVIEEIRRGHAKGIDSPAKALPLAMKTLRQQHEQLSRYFANKAKGKGEKPAPKVAAAVTGKPQDDPKTRKMSVEELIAETVREERGRR